MIGECIVQTLEHVGYQLIEVHPLIEGHIVEAHLHIGDKGIGDITVELQSLTENSGEVHHHMKLHGCRVIPPNQEEEVEICLLQEDSHL